MRDYTATRSIQDSQLKQQQKKVDETPMVFLDIEDIYQLPRGRKVVNAFMASSSTLFKTKRGRMALSVKADTFEKLRAQLNIVLSEGADGLKLVSLKEAAEQVAA